MNHVLGVGWGVHFATWVCLSIRDRTWERPAWRRQHAVAPQLQVVIAPALLQLPALTALRGSTAPLHGLGGPARSGDTRRHTTRNLLLSTKPQLNRHLSSFIYTSFLLPFHRIKFRKLTYFCSYLSSLHSNYTTSYFKCRFSHFCKQCRKLCRSRTHSDSTWMSSMEYKSSLQLNSLFRAQVEVARAEGMRGGIYLTIRGKCAVIRLVTWQFV